MSSSTSVTSASREAVKIAVPILILAGGVAGFMFLMALKSTPASATVEKPALTVETVGVAPHDTGIDIQVDGLAVPFREVALSAQVPGRVKTVSELCRAGKFVHAGDLLIEIDPSDYELEVQRLQHELDQAIATLEEGDVELASTRQLVPLVEEEFQLQTKQVDRLTKLGSAVSTATAIDQARRSKLIAENALRKLEQQVAMFEKRQVRLKFACELAKAQLAKAQLDLERTRITAPVDGVVYTESVEQDSFVQKGTALVTVEDMSKVEVKCNLMMDHLLWLWREQQNGGSPGRMNHASWKGDAPAARAEPARWEGEAPAEPASGVVESSNAFPQSGAFQPRGDFQPTGNSRPQGEFQPTGNVQPADSLQAPNNFPPGAAFQQPGAAGDLMGYDLPKVEVTVLWAFSGRYYAWKGRLDRYDGIGVNEKTRTVACRIVVENPRDVYEARNGDPRDLDPTESGPPALVRGMFVEARIHCHPHTRLLRLPERAIRPGKVVWVLRGGKLEFEKVQLAGIDRDQAIIDAGASNLQAGERVVISPLAFAQEGMEVQEKPAAPPLDQARREGEAPAEPGSHVRSEHAGRSEYDRRTEYNQQSRHEAQSQREPAADNFPRSRSCETSVAAISRGRDWIS